MFSTLKKTLAALIAFALFVPSSFASVESVSVTVSAKAEPVSKYAKYDRTKTMTVKEFFTVAFDLFAEYENVPKSVAYVKLDYANVFPGTPFYASMQKGVYLDLVENVKGQIPLRKTATEDLFSNVVERLTGQSLEATPGKKLTYGVLLDTIADLYDEDVAPSRQSIAGASNYAILNDAYLKLKNEYYDASKVGDEELLQGAISWMADAVGDKHTVYFPPTESKEFQDGLSGEFEGIGTYVDMTVPWVLKIVSPLSWSPAEKAGIKGGDVIVKIDDLVVDETVSIEYAVSKIKGKAGTSVTIYVKRWTENLAFTIVRAKIEIKYVEFKKLSSGTPYIKISTFWDGTLKEFALAAEWIKKNGTDTDKLVIDLRNNPGGNLEDVAAILSYFVPKGESVVKIRYRDSKDQIVSVGSDASLAGRKIAILINGGSASASEIMAGTIKDYLPKTVLVWEKTYGKGSVQNFAPYPDGSSFKYTIAKWFTGKSETGVDEVGILPDLEAKPVSGETSDTVLQKAENALLNVR